MRGRPPDGACQDEGGALDEREREGGGGWRVDVREVRVISENRRCRWENKE